MECARKMKIVTSKCPGLEIRGQQSELKFKGTKNVADPIFFTATSPLQRRWVTASASIVENWGYGRKSRDQVSERTLFNSNVFARTNSPRISSQHLIGDRLINPTALAIEDGMRRKRADQVGECDLLNSRVW